MKLIKLLPIYIFMILSLILVHGANTVTINSPADVTWTDEALNYTSGFNVSWEDPTEANLGTATCNLYIRPSNTSDNIQELNRSVTPLYNEWVNFTAQGTEDVSYSDFIVLNGSNDLTGYYVYGTGDNLGSLKLTVNTYNNSEVNVTYNVTTGLRVEAYKYGEVVLPNRSSTIMYMNSTIPENNTILYVSVECCNSTAFTPACFNADLSLYQDITVPTISIGYINATLTGTIAQNFTINSTQNIVNISSRSGTFQNFTLPDGNYTSANIIGAINGNISGLIATSTPVTGEVILTSNISGSGSILTIGGGANHSMIILGFTVGGTDSGEDTIHELNNTWVDDPNKLILIPVDRDYSYGTSYSCSILNTTDTFGTVSTTNNTAINVSGATIPDGVYTDLVGSCEDLVGNQVNTSVYSLSIDTVTPVIVYQGQTPADGSNQTSAEVNINLSITEQNFDALILSFDGTNYYANSTNNCSGTAPDYECVINVSDVSSKNGIIFYYTVNDSAGNIVSAAGSRTFSVDAGGSPTISQLNWTITDTSLPFNFTITDTTPNACEARVYDRLDTLVTTITGTLGTIGATTECIGTIVPSNIVTSGEFKLQYYAIDDQANSVTSNKTGVMKELDTGWNLITHSDLNNTIQSICNRIQYCTQASVFDNSAKTYTTYSASTPTVNNETNILSGEALLVYVSQDDYYLANQYYPTGGTSAENISLSTGGWNSMGLIVDSNMSSILDMTDLVASGNNVTWASVLNVTSDKYLTCSASTDTCTVTGIVPGLIMLYKGDAVWVLTDAGIVINRTEVT